MTPLQRAPAQLLRRFGHAALSFHALNEGVRYWSNHEGCVPYVEVKGAWVAVANPLVPPERETDAMLAFVEAAARAGKRARFFGVEGPGQVEGGPLRFLKVGEQPVWNPQDWPAGLGKKLRGQLRRAKQHQRVTVRRAHPAELRDPMNPLRRGLDAVITAWLQSRAMAPMGFVVGVHPYHLIEERRVFVAERYGRVVGALIAAPIYARDGWFLDCMPRAPSAPNGTVELLFDHAMQTLADDGCDYVSFGVCPLMNVEAPVLRAARAWGGALYNFAGLQRFKSKLAPASWTPVYVAHSASDHPLVALFDTARAFLPEGLRRFVWDTAHQRTPGILRWPGAALCVVAAGLLCAMFVGRDPAFDLWGVALAAMTGLLGGLVLWLSQGLRPGPTRMVAALGSVTGLGWLSAIAASALPLSLTLPAASLSLGLAGFLWTAAARHPSTTAPTWTEEPQRGAQDPDLRL